MKRYISLLLCFAVLLCAVSGCSQLYRRPQTDDQQEQNTDQNGLPASEYGARGDGIFSLNYDAGDSLNPYTCQTMENYTITPLIYEGLFCIKGDFELEPVLCESWESVGAWMFYFTVKENVMMHDGAPLSIDDVVYSIDVARESSIYADRFKNVQSVYTEDGRVVVVLYASNADFPKLLDIPIVRYGTAYDEYPVGTGPYFYSQGLDYSFLSAFEDWRDSRELPAARIYLQSYEDSNIISAFENGYVDMVTLDRTSLNYYEYGGSYETKYYETPIMQYVGFNAEGQVFSSLEMRQAVQYCIDRDRIVEDVMPENSAVAAELPRHPNAEYYDEEIAGRYAFSFEKAEEIMNEMFFADFDRDGFREILTEAGEVREVSIDFIVNKENSSKLNAARAIADRLVEYGFDVTLRALSWSDYVYELEHQNFDMYYAEVQLTADFDVSCILDIWAELDYGGIGGSDYGSMIDSFLAREEDDSIKQLLASQLYDYIGRNAAIVPVLFKRAAVLTRWGSLSGHEPVYSNLFYGITNWKITLEKS